MPDPDRLNAPSDDSMLPGKNGEKALKRVLRYAAIVCIALLLLGMTIWGTLALFYFDHLNALLRTGLAVAFAVTSVTLLIGFASPRFRWRSFSVYLVLFIVLVSWWSRLAPSNNRDWQPDNAVLAYATINGDMVTVHNIRNFQYRTETDYTPGYYDRTVDLKRLDGVDLVATYWMGPAIAHIFLSFEFQNGQHIAISIESRKERGEGYSTIKGFFRQYELYYVVADERDVIQLRTNIRENPPEEVYIYRLHGSLENGRRLFLQYMKQINSLKKKPEWYNTLTTNCTTVIWMNARINAGHPPFSWKILASGHLPEYLYEIGRLDNSVPFAELKRQAYINARARAADDAVDFSRKIRKGSH